MREPSLRTSRLAIAGALVAAALIGGAGFYLGRTTSPDPASATPGDPLSTPAPQPTVSPIVADGIFGRGDVIELAAAAADAAASGATLPDRVRDAVGRRVEIALPFGCSGPAETDSDRPLRWRYDEAGETLRLHVAVTRWQTADWGLEQSTGEEASDDQAIEGFWIARPWSSSDECPARVTGGQADAAEQSLAIAQFFRGDIRREALREGRPFESVQRIAPGDFAASRGFRLLLSGRIARVLGAQGGLEGPVRCIQPGGIERRPRCIVAVTLDEVRIENPADGAVLASWPIGRE